MFRATDLKYVQWGTEKVGENENNNSAAIVLVV